MKIPLRRLLAVFLAFIVIVPTFLIFFRPPQVEAEWFDDNYAFRQKITFTHNADLTNASMRLTVSNTDTLVSAGKMQSDCDDTRFTDSNGKVLKFRLVSGCNSASTVYDVIFPTVINGSNLAWLYYGNPSALSASDSAVATGTTPSGSPSFATEEKAPSPSLSLKFDEGTGSVAQDSSSNNNDGSISGASWRTRESCLSDNCLFFDGVDDVVTVTNADAIDLDRHLASGFTIETWIKANSDGESNQGTIFWKGMNNWAYIFNEGADGKADLSVSIAFPLLATVTITDGIELNKWTHIAIGYTNDGDDEISVYINGVLRQASTNGAGNFIGDTSTLYIGNTISNAFTFHGFIDDFKIYPYERSASQIGADYASKISSVHGVSTSFGDDQSYLSNGLVGYWKMDESSGNAADSSGTGLTLTNNSAMAYSVGKFANAAQCDGTADYLNTATQINNIKSVSFWVYPAAAANNYFINLINSSTYITINSSGVVSATGFTSPSIYVNGVLNGTVSASAWSLITISSDTNINANAFAIGLTNDGSNHFCTNTSKIDDVRIYNRSLSPSEITRLYDWAPGPVGWWKMDESTGTSTSDSSGNGNAISTFTGNTAWTRGKYGNGLIFDGTDNNIQRTEASAFDLGAATDSYSIEAWFKTTANYSGNASVVAKDDGSGAYPYELYLNSSEYGCFQISDGTNAPSACGTSTLNDGKWHNIAGIRDINNDKVYLYIDGIQITSTTDSTAATAANNDNLSIGNAGASYTANDFNGAIDDVRIYNYARTQKQIIQDMNGGHPAVGSPVGSAIVHYKFDEGYGTTTRSYGSCATCSATLTNMDSPATYGSGWTNNGKFGKALNFDGVDNYVNVDDSPILYSNTLTVGAWVYDNDLTTIKYLISKRSSLEEWTIYITGTGKPAWIAWNDAGSAIFSITSNTSIDLNSWHHIVGTTDGSTANLYVDGILRGTSSVTGTIFDTSSAISIGNCSGAAARCPSESTRYFKGTIDDVSIYNYALNADEIKVAYNQGKAAVWGASGTNADSRTASDSASRAYCPPGNSQTNCAGTGVLDPAPYGEWKFDEYAGQSAYDSSGKANTGTLGIDANPGSDDPTWIRGKFGPALKFDGVDDYVETANSISITGSSTRTLSAWVYINSFNADCWNIVAVYGAYFNYQSFGILYDCDSMVFNGFGLGDFDSNLPVTTKTWYHMAITYDGTTVRTFLNGIEGASKAEALSTGNSRLGIGANLLGGSHYTPYAVIDDVRIYDYARTPAQIAWDYNRGRPVGWWKFDECQGATTHDTSGNNYNATIYPVTLGNTAVGTCNSGTSTDMWNDGTTGKFNASLGFDGSDDYAQISDTANLRFDSNSQDYSLFAWIKRTTTGTEYIISKEDADNDGWRMMLNASNQVLCSEDATDVTSASTITDTNWHHIGCTIDRDGNGQVYIDGSASGSTVSMGSDAMATTSNIRIGTRSYTSTNYFNGLIDDARIYNYVLSPAQIRTLYNEDSALRFGPLTGSP